MDILTFKRDQYDANNNNNNRVNIIEIFVALVNMSLES